jgi:hypothetical protein
MALFGRLRVARSAFFCGRVRRGFPASIEKALRAWGPFLGLNPYLRVTLILKKIRNIKSVVISTFRDPNIP